MPRRKFVYGNSGLLEVTPDADRAICDAIHKDAASRTAPLEFGLPRSRSEWHNATCWPIHSETMACSDADRVREEQGQLAMHGVTTDYDEHFRPIWTSQSHKKRHLRALGYADGDAGYGDAAPLNATSRRDRKRERSKKLADAKADLIEKEIRLFGCRVSNL